MTVISAKKSTAEGLKSKFKQTLCQSPGSLCEWSSSRFCLTDNNLGFPIFEESCSGLFLNIFFTENNEQSGSAGKKTSVSGFYMTICDIEQMSGLCMQMLNCCYITDDGNQRGNTFQRWFKTTASSSAPMVFKRQCVLYTGTKSTVKPFHCKSESPPAHILHFLTGPTK